MTQTKPCELPELFLDAIREWHKLEDVTIQLIRTTTEMIRHDSEKQKVMLQMLIESLTKEALHLNPEKLSLLSEALENHLESETRSIEFAEFSLEKSNVFVAKCRMLSHLIADERKHHSLLGKLNELKKRQLS